MHVPIGTALVVSLAFLPRTPWAEQIPFDIVGNTKDRIDGTVKNDTRRVITPKLSEFIQEIVHNSSIPGLSLGVVYGDDNVEFGTWGRKTEDGDAMTTDTLFYLASCSKAFLSSLVGILMDDFAHGRNNTPLPPNLTRFDWHTKVKDILPGDWKLMDDWASEKATLRDILSHQSGLAGHDFSYTATDDALSVIHRMRHLRPVFELRQRYHYNNQMYILGSYLVAKYSGMSYMKFVKTKTWDPLNMSSTTFYESEASRDGKLTQAWTSEGRRIPFWMPDELVLLNAGPGGIITSTVDMVKWVRMLLNSGVDPATNATVLPKSVFEMITTVQIPIDGRAAWPEFSFSGYGMGWERLSYQGHELVFHNGGVPGVSTWVFLLPSDKLGLVMLANADRKHREELAAIYRIIEDFLGLERKHSSRILSTIHRATTIQDKPEFLQKNQLNLSSPPLPLEAYAGVYVDPGYPNITVCAPTSNSLECTQALEDFAHFEDVNDSRTLYLIIPSIWASHGRLTYREGNTFALFATYLFPHGYGKDRSAFETGKPGESQATVDFVLGEPHNVVGMGMRGLVGETTDRERMGGTVEETAEVYFVKA